MATVINVATIKPLIDQLGWGQLNVAEALGSIKEAGIPPVAVLAYLNALVASPTGLDDQTITGCDPAVATQITVYLTQKGVIAA